LSTTGTFYSNPFVNSSGNTYPALIGVVGFLIILSTPALKPNASSG
jgi:hypothetical protein